MRQCQQKKSKNTFHYHNKGPLQGSPEDNTMCLTLMSIVTKCRLYGLYPSLFCSPADQKLDGVTLLITNLPCPKYTWFNMRRFKLCLRKWKVFLDFFCFHCLNKFSLLFYLPHVMVILTFVNYHHWDGGPPNTQYYHKTKLNN